MDTLNTAEQVVSAIAGETRRRFGKQIEVIWFGSWVQGTAHPGSDFDVAIHSDGTIDDREFSQLWEWVEDLPTLYSVDLVNLAEARSSLREEILRTGRLV